MNYSNHTSITDFVSRSRVSGDAIAIGKARGAAFAGAYGLEYLDFLILQKLLRPEQIFAVREGSKILGKQMADDAGDLDLEIVARVLSGGGSLVVLSLQSCDWSIRSVARNFAAATHCAVHTNAYITPPMSQTLPEHTDPYSVAVVQLAGSKRWRLRETQAAVPEIVELEPGDSLYVRKDTWHQAEALGSTSMHLTFAIRDEVGGGQDSRTSSPSGRTLSSTASLLDSDDVGAHTGG